MLPRTSIKFAWSFLKVGKLAVEREKQDSEFENQRVSRLMSAVKILSCMRAYGGNHVRTCENTKIV